MDAIAVLRRAAERVTPKRARRLLEIADMLERAPAERRPAILDAAATLDPALQPLRPAGASMIPAAPPAYRTAGSKILARLVLGETPAQISGLTRREAHAWLLTGPWLSPAEWLWHRHCPYPQPFGLGARAVAVVRWILAALNDPQRRAALERERCERGPHGEEIRGRLLDRVDELIDRDLRPSVDATFTRAAQRRWKEAERLLARKREPLASPPRWWRPIRCARLLLSGADLIVEGKQLRHCVASYAPYVARGTSVIIALDVCGHRSTVEIDRSSGQVLQHRGPENAEPHALCVRALETLKRKWRIET
jgi:hypothetical protein